MSSLLVPSMLPKPKWVHTLDLNVDGASLTVALLSSIIPVQTLLGPIHFRSSLPHSCDKRHRVESLSSDAGEMAAGRGIWQGLERLIRASYYIKVLIFGSSVLILISHKEGR